MIHVIKTRPTLEPVSLAEMRAFLGINDVAETARDSVITARIATARQIAESYVRKALITQTWRGVADDFSDGVLRLVAPLQSVSSIKYTDSNGVQQTVSISDYYVRKADASVCSAYSKSWPTVRADLEPVIVEYISGYGDTAADVPTPIREAISLIVMTWEKFQSSLDGLVGYPPDLPRAAKSLLDPYVDYRNLLITR